MSGVGWHRRQGVEAVLRRWCVGAQVIGVRFAFSPVILLEDVTPRESGSGPVDPAPGEIEIAVESWWAIYPNVPSALPTDEQEAPQRSLAERVGALARLRDQRIVAASLGELHPHLLLTFEKGSMCFINGYHERFECWELRLTAAPERGVVALPGGGLAIWGPPDDD